MRKTSVTLRRLLLPVLLPVVLSLAHSAPPAGASVPLGATTVGSISGAAAGRCAAPPRASKLKPARGAWFGVSIDWEQDSLAAYSRRLRSAPAVAVTFAGLPLSRGDRANLDAAIAQARGTHSMLLITLEPHRGLDKITNKVAVNLARRLARYNRKGVPVFVRFAHEMNGSWYPWSQNPRLYVAKFRKVAAAVHRLAPGSAMLWAPNYGGGYPFTGGQYAAQPGTPAAAALDTNRDGTVTGADDPYAPYWPGKRSVDWVGMSLYHWGSRYPWGENEIPEAGKFVDLLRGRYNGAAGDERAVPDFYREYGARKRLPVAVTETAAFHARGAGGAASRVIKRAWWRQVFAPGLARSLPRLKMINWFEWTKHEVEVGAVVDWGVTRPPRTLKQFRKALPRWLRFADDVPTCR